jgi:class 3 adenylate cyclase
VSLDEYCWLLVSRLGGTGGSHARSSKETRQKGEAVAPSGEYRERSLVMVLLDLARFTSVIAELSLRETTELLDEFYRAADEVVVGAGGRVVKFVGDGCLAAFEPSDVLPALEAVDAVGVRVADIGATRGVTLELGANVHVANVAEVSLGSSAVAELVGIGVVHTYRMGGGPGVRISEPVYRKLPSANRTPWRKHQPPAVYRRETR